MGLLVKSSVLQNIHHLLWYVCKHQHFSDELLVIAILVHVMQAQKSEPAYNEAMGLVDHFHPGQGGDFEDEGSATLPGRKDKDRSKGAKNYGLYVIHI